VPVPVPMDPGPLKLAMVGGYARAMCVCVCVVCVVCVCVCVRGVKGLGRGFSYFFAEQEGPRRTLASGAMVKLAPARPSFIAAITLLDRQKSNSA